MANYYAICSTYAFASYNKNSAVKQLRLIDQQTQTGRDSFTARAFSVLQVREEAVLACTQDLVDRAVVYDPQVSTLSSDDSFIGSGTMREITRVFAQTGSRQA
jgi:hypothetical protein